MPSTLGPIGAELWAYLVAEVPWISRTDYPALLSLCSKADRLADLIAQLGDEYVLRTDKGYAYANPLVSMVRGVETEMVKLYSLLGLTPADRTRMGLAEVRAQSHLEELRSRRKHG